ncbi:hypothetical protein PoB_000319800 [Plakobranchus ocellatus]|uniref:Uncharacterized protein n=1 Tax=Plakobranchus ocellatus TaxID=259542 RepID=A0AAV3Y2Z5_9GAST|nr:hypothetical protein PoB_000319800 [Plakobranchus ocellatus]
MSAQDCPFFAFERRRKVQKVADKLLQARLAIPVFKRAIPLMSFVQFILKTQSTLILTEGTDSKQFLLYSTCLILHRSLLTGNQLPERKIIAKGGQNSLSQIPSSSSQPVFTEDPSSLESFTSSQQNRLVKLQKKIPKEKADVYDIFLHTA